MHSIQLDSPQNLADHLRAQRIPLKMSCGGNGSCRTCRVLVDGEPVLACQTRLERGCYDLTVPPSGGSSINIQIDLDSLAGDCPPVTKRLQRWKVTLPPPDEFPHRSNRWRLEKALGKRALSPLFFRDLSHDRLQGSLDIYEFDDEPLSLADEERKFFAFAIDIGTTTVAAALLDLETGETVDALGRLNRQYSYAEDLVARISFCRTPELLEEMRDLILRHTLAPLLRGLLKQNGVRNDDLLTSVISGNATMIHLLLGLDPTGMGGWPFNGIDYAPDPIAAVTCRLPGRTLEFVPSASAYVGGDIISGLQYLDFEYAPDRTLFVDLGTNAEIALKANGKLYCSAVPAGPSFEGGGLACGISAIPGAIEKVWNDGEEIHWSTIHNEPAAGLCGSGVISFVAAAFRAGILRKKGRFARRHPKVERKILLGEEEKVYSLTDDIYVSETDISTFLQAKAAVFSGIITLCRVAEIEINNLKKVYLAGNFGRRVDLRDLIDIGILPPLPEEAIEVCGNTSLKGAINAAVDADARPRMDRLIQQLHFVELNEQPNFQNDFINALFIPHLTLDFRLTDNTTSK